MSGPHTDQFSRSRWPGSWLRSWPFRVGCVLLLGLVLIALEIERRERRQQASLEYFKQFSAWFRRGPAEPVWLRRLVASTFGEERAAGFTDVTEAYLGWDVTDDALRHLCAFPNLQKLDLRNTRVSDKGLLHISELSRLNSLEISYGAGITDEGMQYLRGLTELEVLVVYGTEITDAGLVQLSGHTRLRELCLGNSAIKGSGLKHLSGLTNLKELRLQETLISDDGLRHLGGLRKLEFLSLRNTRVTDDGLQHLGGLKSLKHIIVSVPVTFDGVAELQAALPNCHIQTDSAMRWARKSRAEIVAQPTGSELANDRTSLPGEPAVAPSDPDSSAGTPTRPQIDE